MTVRRVETWRLLHEARLDGAVCDEIVRSQPVPLTLLAKLVKTEPLRMRGQPTMMQTRILQGLAEGKSCTVIAEQLGITRHTVNGHLKSVYRSLRVHSALQATVIALRAGWIDYPERASVPSD